MAFATHHAQQSASPFLQEQAEELLSSFEAPLKEFVRLVKSAKNVMADRSSALQAMHQVIRACPSGH